MIDKILEWIVLTTLRAIGPRFEEFRDHWDTLLRPTSPEAPGNGEQP